MPDPVVHDPERPEPGAHWAPQTVYQIRLLVRDFFKGIGPIMATVAAIVGSYAGYQSYQNAGHSNDLKNTVIARSDEVKAEASEAKETAAVVSTRAARAEQKLDKVVVSTEKSTTKFDLWVKWDDAEKKYMITGLPADLAAAIKAKKAYDDFVRNGLP